MNEGTVSISLKVTAEIGDKNFEHLLTLQDLTKLIKLNDLGNLKDTLKKFILQSCGDKEILEALATDDIAHHMVYNPNLPWEMADKLADELFQKGKNGEYPYKLCVILSNPSMSPKMLDYYAKYFLDEYHYYLETDGRPNYDIIYLLRYIAENKSVSIQTIRLLKESGIPLVLKAISEE